MEGLTLSFPLLYVQTYSQRLYQEYTCYTVFFVSIEICQISDVLIRKTRRLSAFQQGFFRSAKTRLYHDLLLAKCEAETFLVCQ